MSQKHASKTQMNRRKITIISSIVAALIVICYGVFGMHFQSHFLPGTTAYGVEINGLTTTQATEKLQTKLKSTEFVLKDKKTKIASITGKELGIQKDFSPLLKEKMDNQNAWLFKTSETVEGNGKGSETSFDLKQITSFVNKLFPQINTGRTVTQNAKIVNKGGEFTVVPEVKGNNFNQKEVNTLVANAIQNGEQEIQLDKNYVKPEITKDSTKIKNLISKMNKLSNMKATYTIAGNTVTIPKATLASWLVSSGDKVLVNSNLVSAYLSGLNSQYATFGSTRQFKSTKRGKVSVPGGIYGWSINVSAETSTLVAAILKGDDFTKEPTIQGTGYHKDGTDIGSTYVEVDKVNQHMYVYKNGSLIISTDVVTGKPGQDTPIGVYNVWAKQRNATLRGNKDDGSKYASPVSYWMPIDNTGVGLHDSPWQPKYGGDWYVTHGSHGCVNTPPSVMSQVYAQVEIGTPVIVF